MEAKYKNILPQEGTGVAGESLPDISSGCPTYSGGGNVLHQAEKKITKRQTQQVFHKGLFITRERTTPVNEKPSRTHQQETEQEITDLTNTQDESEEPWTETAVRKRVRNSPDNMETRKQIKLPKYWLSQPTPVSNSFEALKIDDSPNENHKTAVKQPKPPPIFVDKVSVLRPLTELLNECANDNYELKVLQNERVKIQPKTPDAYRIIVKHLENKETEFFTYKLKQERSFKVILKHMHPSMETEDIREALEEKDHIVTNIWNIKQRITKKPLHMFVVELKPNDNNKTIYDLKSLLNCRIIFEPPRPKRSIPQCSNCQQYGHTKAYCYRKPKCIKCAGDHHSIECSRKERSDMVKCVLCSGNHPANYKGCAIYKDLQKQKYPALRNKQKHNVKENIITEMEAPRNQPKTIPIVPPKTQKYFRPNASYAHILQNARNKNNDIATPKEPSSDMKHLIEMLKQFTQQMTNLTELIINLTSTLVQNSMP